MATERRPHPSQRRAPAKKAPAKKAPVKKGERALRSGHAQKQTAWRSKKKGQKARSPRAKPKKTYRAPLRVPLGNSPRRLRVVMVAMAISLSLCAGRLLQLQGFDSSAYAAISAQQLTTTLPLLPSRGEIVDRNGETLASTEAAVAITADPTYTAKNAAKIAAVIEKYVYLDNGDLMAALTKKDTKFVYLAKQVPAATYIKLAAELSKAGLYGVFRESDPIRTHPAGSVGASVVGFVGADGQGQGGLEYSLNSFLAGVKGEEIYESAPNGSRIPLGNSVVTPARNGTDYELTLDSELQWAADQRLAAQVKKSKGESGILITMSIKTGEILAMSNYPTFDANDPGAADAEDRGNRAVTNAYEPGSVEKVLTSAALIEEGIANPETQVVVPSTIESGGGRIKDHFEHGELNLNMRGIISRSSNIGTVMLARQMEQEKLRKYLADFGLGKKTGIGLPGEAEGYLPPADMEDYTRDQIAFGQGVSVTAVQMAAALAGILNDGVYNAPSIIKSATDSDGAAVDLKKPDPRRIVSADTSAQVRDLMQAVVSNPNQIDQLSLDNYQTGGKTGTAERIDPDCKCYRGYTASYAGFAPVDDPEILTYVVIDNPQNAGTGTANAVPVYQDIMNMALPRYSVQPSTKRPDEPVLEW